MKALKRRRGQVEILIAEDSPTQAEHLRHLLERNGYVVVSAANGKLALELAKKHKPALIISDVVMPEMDGFALCQAIKSDRLMQDIPVVLTTSLTEMQEILKGLECGADNFIRKPYEEKHLLTRIDALLLMQKMRNGEKVQMGLEISLQGKRHFINFERQQIIDLLFSVFEEAMQINLELKQREQMLEQDIAQRMLSEKSLQKAMSTVRKQEQQLRAILDTVADGVITTDSNGLVESANPAAVNIFGYQPDEIIGRNVSLLLSDQDGKQYLSEKNPYGIDVSREVIGKHKDGSHFPLEVEVNQYEVDGEIFFTRTLHDVRERNRLMSDLIQARTAAEEANQAKSKFLANMSHEIRTPMNAIIGLSHLCLQTSLEDKQRDYVGKVHHSARALLGILNDILDFSKIEAGKLTLEAQDFELNTTLANVDSVIGHLTRDKGLYFEVQVTGDVPRFLHGDALRLGQVLLNLAGNAVKFTQQGGVTLSVSLSEDDGQLVRLEFSVKDSGVGLSPEHLERLFQPFSQADASTTRRFGGTGLGLAICLRLVDLMGGRLWVESALGVGSDFRFTACFAHGRESPSAPASSLEEQVTARARLKNARILLAEDNLFNQQVALELLGNVGATVTVVSNGNEVLEALVEQSYDLVLMDVQMPEMDGYEATRHIRANPELSELRVIAMTANAMAEDRQRCLSAGMDDFITKPIDPNLLYLKLASWLTHPGTARTIRATAIAEPPAIDLHILGSFINNDPANIRKFAIQFLETTGKTLVEMKAAHARRDLQALGALGHQLKSSARTVGALGFGDLCEALQEAAEAGNWPAAEALLLQLPVLLERIAYQVEQQTH